MKNTLIRQLYLIAFVMVAKCVSAQQLIQDVPVDTSIDGQTECVIAVNPTDSLNLIAAYMDDSTRQGYWWIYVKFSKDGGLSWNKGTIPTGGFESDDPWVAFAANGTAYLSGLPDGTIMSSSDGGANWINPIQLFVGDSVIADEPVIALDNYEGSPFSGTVYSAVVNSGTGIPNGIDLKFHRPGAQGPSATTRVSQQSIVQIPDIVIDPNGSIYISYIGVTDISTLSGGFYFNKSTDGGRTFGSDQLIVSAHYTDSVNGFPKQGFPLASRIGPTPRIAIDTSKGPRRGWLYVCYALPTEAGFPPALNIFIQHSTDTGTTWSDPIRINNDPISSSNDHLTPTMVINPDGIIGVAFYDRRDDPNNLLANLYFAISMDGGLTFSNTRVTPAPTNPLLGYISSNISIADYIGLAATRSHFFPIWTDGRKNNGDLDIYSAIVPIPAASGVSSASNTIHEIQTFPNPISRSTEITLTSQAPGYAEVSIVNMLGVEVARLFSGELGAGEHSFTWDADGTSAPRAPQGTYECLVRMNGQVETLPVLLMR